MKTGLRTQKIAAFLLIAALFAPYFVSVGIVPTKVAAAEDPIHPVIVVDMSHGEYSSYVYGEEDTWLANNLTAMGFEVIFAGSHVNIRIPEARVCEVHPSDQLGEL